MTRPSSDPTDTPARPRGLLRRFRRDQRGVTAVEFGMVATPFFALLFAIIETALVFWTTQVLETAVTNASRRVYTCLLYTSPSPRDKRQSRMPSSA